MSRLLAVAARELRERWLLFPGAFVAGFFPLVMPAFGVERELVPTVGLTGAALLGAAAAVIDRLVDAGARRGGRPPGLPVLPAAALGDDLGRQVARRHRPGRRPARS